MQKLFDKIMEQVRKDLVNMFASSQYRTIMKYPTVIVGKDFNRLTYEEVLKIKLDAGRIAQHGIKYIYEKAVVFTSNTMEDLNDAFVRNNGRWAHSKSPNRVQHGWKVYVVPNSKLMTSVDPSEIFGIQFTAIGRPSKDGAESLKWTSERR